MDTKQLGSSLGSILSKTQWRLRNYFQKRIHDESLGITVEQWSVLAAIDSKKITQSEIAKRIEKDKTNVTRMIDLLEKKGFIARTDIPNDRRGYYINITTEGRRIIERIIPIANEVNKIGMLGFSKTEQKVFINSLKKIMMNFSYS